MTTADPTTLREQILDILWRKGLGGPVADAILALPEMRRASRITAFIDAEPEWVKDVVDDAWAEPHDDLLARAKAAGDE